MTFWLLVAILVVLAIGFCLPLWRGAAKGDPVGAQDIARARDSAASAREAYNAGLYADYQQELAEDLRLDEATKAALLADKARQLIDDTRHLNQTTPAVSRSTRVGSEAGWGVKLAVLGLVIVGSLATYFELGTPGAEQLVQAREILNLPSLGELDGNEGSAEAAKLRALTAGLRDHVTRSPDQAGSWYLLGIGELKLGSYSESAQAFEAAHKLVGADANLDLYWLQARLLADNGQLSEATKGIAARVLATQPNQPMVLNMLALAAFRSDDFSTAVGYLNSALSNNITEGQRQLLASGFEQARTALGVAGPTVDVALTLPAERPADAVVFVIARPVGGGIPYAVVRRPVGGVPKQVRLDDAVSMNPANPLSAAQEVEIVVRLSLTGRPQAGPGDWQWRSAPLRLKELSGPAQLSAELLPPATKPPHS